MCESSVFVRRGQKDELLAESVARIIPDKDVVRVMTLFGEESRVEGKILEIDLMAHKILLEEKS